MEPFIKIREVSRLTGIPIITLRRWINEGVGPEYRRSPTGKYLFRQSEIERWVESLDGSPESHPDADQQGKGQNDE